MSIPLQPLTSHVIALRLDPETLTRGGIVIPDAAQEIPNRAVVLAVGPGAMLPSGVRVPVDIHENDVIVLAPNSGTEIEVNGVVLTFVKAEHILAVEQAA